MKRCPKCQKKKHESLFHKNRSNRDGLSSYCAECAKALHKKRYRANSAYREKTKREWLAWSRTEEGKKSIRRNRLLREYGLTEERFAQILKEQQGLCPICLVDIQSDPHVDHCHATGEVRGLLCPRCNRGLGMFKDNPEALQRAIEYLVGVQTS